jgi:chromosomal replication initiator protein
MQVEQQKITSQWQSCLQFMRDNINAIEDMASQQKLEKSFASIFEAVQPLSMNGQELTLLVPSDFYREYIEEHYLSLFAAGLKRFFGKGTKLFYAVQEAPMKLTPTPERINLTHYPAQSTPTPQPQMVAPTEALPKNTINPFVTPAVNRYNINSYLNAQLSFENYIEGDSNQYAYKVAKTIASRPGITSFNPLFLYGGVGVGKTHLAHAIGLEVKAKFPDKIVLYISSEKFIQQFITASKAQQKTEFANFYQMIDVFIIDDIQFLSSKKATQEMFFHIFDHLHQNGKQIVLTSDKAPADIQDLEERVLSRFKWGLTIDIKAPDFNTKRQIIINKLSRDGIVLQDDMVDYLATELKSNVRELIGVVNSVIAFSMIKKQDLSLDLLKETIARISSTQKKTINLAAIQEIICEHFGVSAEDIVSKSRKRIITLPRQLVMYFAKEYTPATYVKIGQEMGKRDHTTVMHACKAIKNDMQTNKEISQHIDDIKLKIQRF